MYSKPCFLQGVFPFEGKGMTTPSPLDETLSYTVPVGKRTQFVYFRAGNSTGELVFVVILRDGKPMRYFPLGAKSDVHVALAVVEDLLSNTRIDIQIAAPEGINGFLVLDVGMVEI